MKTDNCPLELLDSLEDLISRYGIVKVMEKLRTVCFEKSEHINHSWQDEQLAALWDKTGYAVNKAVLDVEKLHR